MGENLRFHAGCGHAADILQAAFARKHHAPEAKRSGLKRS